jgi:hypothetical protein
MIHAQELLRAYRANPRQTLADISESLSRGREGKPGGLKPEDFSLRDLAAAFIVDDHGESIGLANLERLCRGQLLESTGALTPSMFATITGQIVNVAFMEGYTLPEFVLSAAVPTISGTATQARLTGVSLPMKDQKVLELNPGQEYPSVGMYEEYVKTPETVKRGAILSITKEAILQDAGSQILDQARRLGELIGKQKELALTDYIIGAVSNCVIEKRVGDSSEQTCDLFYSSTDDSPRYVNTQANAFSDWTDIDKAEELFLGITMPGTGEVPSLTQRTILIPPQLRSAVSRVLSATETRSGSSNIVVAGNPVANLSVRTLTSPWVYSRLAASGAAEATAAGTWFYGDLARAFRYYQNWGLTVEEDRSGAVAFTHDILVRFKASEKGTPAVVEPRFWSKQTPS